MIDARHVAIETCFERVVSDTTTIPVCTTLSYTSREPWAVGMTFQLGPNREIEWLMARELLKAGLTDTGGGIGDIVMRPMPSRPGHVEVVLRPSSERAAFAAPIADLQAFLDETYRVVPPGSEMDDIDLDGELAAIVASGAPIRAEDSTALAAILPAGSDEVWLHTFLGELDFEHAARCQCECKCNDTIGGFASGADAPASEHVDGALCSRCRRHCTDGSPRA